VHPNKLNDFGASAQQVYDFLRAHDYSIQRYLGHRQDGRRLQPIEPTATPCDRTHMLLCV
jgi:hypothetical protein